MPKKFLSQEKLYLLFLLSLLLPNIFLLFSPYLSPLSKAIGLLMPAGAYMWLLSRVKKPGKMLLWLLLAVVMNMVQLVLLSVFPGSVIAVDVIMSTFSASGDEAGELLSGLIYPIISVGIGYLLVLMLAVVSLRMNSEYARASRKRWGVVGLITLLLSLPLWALARHQNERYSPLAEVYPLNVWSNLYLSARMVGKIINYPETSRNFRFASTTLRTEPEVYILIIGETSRAYSWSLYGYERETNPLLSQRRNELMIFGDVLTQSNTTAKSVPILLSPADAKHSGRLSEVKGLLEAYREAGFYTVFISNQPANRSFVDYFAYQANEHHAIRDELRTAKAQIYDADMLPTLSKTLKSGHQKLLVVMHGYGSHFKYSDRYPESSAFFADDKTGMASVREKPRLVNGYDNAVRYTDSLISQVIAQVEQTSRVGAVMYIADHGEDLFDDQRERILHSSPSVSYYQLHIPCLIWASPAYRTAYPELVATMQANRQKSVSSNITFHTMLSLAGVRTRERIDSLSLVSPRCSSAERYYLNDRYEAVPIAQMGLTSEDIEVMRRMKVRPH